MTAASKSRGGIPRWVKVQGACIALLMLAVISMSMGVLGRHGHGEAGSTYIMPPSHDQHMDGRR